MLSLLGAAGMAAPATARDNFMDCGDAPLCGVVVLETGLGSGTYRHDEPVVHGLWPETGSYGSSKCIKPKDSSDAPADVYTCYNQHGESKGDLLSFERHEWSKHGQCAGVRDAKDFFGQLCELTKAPLGVMAAARKAGHVDLTGYAQRLTAAGYPVFATDESHMQVELSACAGDSGTWILADPSEFGVKCGAGSGSQQLVEATGCDDIKDKKDCDNAKCSWCLAGAVPPSCKTIDEAKALPPSIFQCDKI